MTKKIISLKTKQTSFITPPKSCCCCLFTCQTETTDSYDIELNIEVCQKQLDESVTLQGKITTLADILANFDQEITALSQDEYTASLTTRQGKQNQTALRQQRDKNNSVMKEELRTILENHIKKWLKTNLEEKTNALSKTHTKSDINWLLSPFIIPFQSASLHPKFQSDLNDIKSETLSRRLFDIIRTLKSTTEITTWFRNTAELFKQKSRLELYKDRLTEQFLNNLNEKPTIDLTQYNQECDKLTAITPRQTIKDIKYMIKNTRHPLFSRLRLDGPQLPLHHYKQFYGNDIYSVTHVKGIQTIGPFSINSWKHMTQDNRFRLAPRSQESNSLNILNRKFLQRYTNEETKQLKAAIEQQFERDTAEWEKKKLEHDEQEEQNEANHPGGYWEYNGWGDQWWEEECYDKKPFTTPQPKWSDVKYQIPEYKETTISPNHQTPYTHQLTLTKKQNELKELVKQTQQLEKTLNNMFKNAELIKPDQINIPLTYSNEYFHFVHIELCQTLAPHAFYHTDKANYGVFLKSQSE